MAKGTFIKNFNRVVDAVEEFKKTRKEKIIPSSVLLNYLMEKTNLSKSVLIHYMPLLERKGVIKRPAHSVVEL